MAWIVAIILTIGCWLLLEKSANISHNVKEPPLIPQSVPYVGHLLGMLRDGSRYYTKIRSVPSIDGYPKRTTKSLTQIQRQVSPTNIHSSCAIEQDIYHQLTQSRGGRGPPFKDCVIRPLRCPVRQTNPSPQRRRTGCFGGEPTRRKWRVGLPTRNAQSHARCFSSRGRLGSYDAGYVRQCVRSPGFHAHHCKPREYQSFLMGQKACYPSQHGCDIWSKPESIPRSRS